MTEKHTILTGDKCIAFNHRTYVALGTQVIAINAVIIGIPYVVTDDSQVNGCAHAYANTAEV
jgi:hypothetical protein